MRWEALSFTRGECLGGRSLPVLDAEPPVCRSSGLRTPDVLGRWHHLHVHPSRSGTTSIDILQLCIKHWQRRTESSPSARHNGPQQLSAFQITQLCSTARKLAQSASPLGSCKQTMLASHACWNMMVNASCQDRTKPSKPSSFACRAVRSDDAARSSRSASFRPASAASRCCGPALGGRRAASTSNLRAVQVPAS